VEVLEVRSRARPASQRHDGTQQHVPGPHLADVETTAVEQVEQALAGVAAHVVDGLVVLGPQPRVGRHGHEVGAGRLEHAAHLRHRGVVVVEVLEQVEGHDEVERVVREREPGRVAA